MATETKQIMNELKAIRTELGEVKAIMKEDFELSAWTKKELKKARAETKGISHREIMKKYSHQY